MAIAGAPVKLDLARARRILIDRTGLHRPFGEGSAGALQAIEHLGYVQIDTIAVLERAHHHILWNRVAEYSPAHLRELQEKDRSIFEYWTHALAYVPTRDWPIYARMMREIRLGRHPWYQPKPVAQMRAVMRRIRREGPLGVSDFEETHPGPRQIWFARKPAKRGLESALYAGQLVVDRRAGFEKIYELTERAIPAVTSLRPASLAEAHEHHLQRAIRSFGVFTVSQVLHLRKATAQAALEVYLRRNARRLGLIPVELPLGKSAPWWTTEEVLDNSARQPDDSGRAHVLSPFDPLVILRPRLRAIFGWDYTIECYVPAAKRQHGYFCLPLLWQDQFVGRIDCKADRARGRLLVQSFSGEAPAAKSAEFRRALAAEMEAFARFNGCADLSLHFRRRKSLDLAER